jgi:Putative addiction module component
MTRQQIKLAAMQLEPAEREALAEELLLSVSEADRAEIDAAWLQEAKKRDSAEAPEFSPVDQVLQRLKNKPRA